MKTIMLLIWMMAGASVSYSQVRINERKELQKLLLERKQKFSEYLISLEKKSGFFGGKSKLDLKKSNEVLTAVVETDNKIIKTLYRAIDFKNFEKTNMNYNLLKLSQKTEDLLQASDTLYKQVEFYKQQNQTLNQTVRWQRVLIVLFFLMLLFLAYTKRKLQLKLRQDMQDP